MADQKQSRALVARLRENVGADNEMVLTLEAMLATLDEVTGECRREEPFAVLRPVLSDEGLRYCCTHETEHCSKVVGT